MDKAKAAVSDFMHKSGKHDTTVHETVAPAVQHETVKPHQHEDVTTAVDKEVHQDHYHRTVQPVRDREVLPEQHTAKLGAVQHREFDHRDNDNTKRNLAAEQQAFHNERQVQDKTHSQSAAPVVGGERAHHHIHETIQPVVEKETVQPSVVHTTVPIHEVHHNSPQHHQTSELPAMTMEEFKNQGGVLGGREERYDGFEGEPKHIGGTLKHMMDGKTSKRDSGHAHGLEEGSKHGDFDPLDGGRDNDQNASGLTGSAGTTGGSTGNRDNHSSGLTGNRDHPSRGLGNKDAAGGTATGGGATGAAGGLEDHTHGNARNPGTTTDSSLRQTNSSSSSESDGVGGRRRKDKEAGVGGKIKSMVGMK